MKVLVITLFTLVLNLNFLVAGEKFDFSSLLEKQVLEDNADNRAKLKGLYKESDIVLIADLHHIKAVFGTLINRYDLMPLNTLKGEAKVSKSQSESGSSSSSFVCYAKMDPVKNYPRAVYFLKQNKESGDFEILVDNSLKGVLAGSKANIKLIKAVVKE